jgi:hypothetical protein
VQFVGATLIIRFPTLAISILLKAILPHYGLLGMVQQNCRKSVAANSCAPPSITKGIARTLISILRAVAVVTHIDVHSVEINDTLQNVVPRTSTTRF